MIRAVAALALALLAPACMSIGAFNNTTPHDAGVVRVAHDVPYGEGPRRTLDVYAPEGQPAHAPVIVFFYGGSWSYGAKEEYAFAGEAFAAQGFVTVVPDYRLYPEVQFPGFVEDGAAALHWVRAEIAGYGGDPSRIVLVGHSAGAHIATLVALDPRYAAEAGFDRHAIRGVVGLAGAYGFDNFDMPLLRNVFGAAPDPRATMPVNYVDRTAPPLLLLHGDRDTRVPPRSSQIMYQRATAAGERAEIRMYPGLDHPGILQALAMARRNEAPVLSDAVTFARRVTGQSGADAAQSGAN